MKRRSVVIALAMLFCAASAATALAQGPVVKDPKPKPILLKPDLTISDIIWRSKPSTVVVVVANVGKAKAENFVVGFGCQTKPNDKGISVGFGAQAFVQELLPNQKRRITLDCKSATIKGARVDGENKVSESDESNNEVSF